MSNMTRQTDITVHILHSCY